MSISTNISYGCNSCGRIFTTLEEAEKHSKKCIFNPENKGCLTCKHNIHDDHRNRSDGGCNYEYIWDDCKLGCREIIGYKSFRDEEITKWINVINCWESK